VPFDEALAKLIPKPGVQASQTDDERMTRFRGWLSSRYSEPESDEQKWLLRMLTDQGHFTSQVIEADARQILVGEMIAKMKKEGIPPWLFSKACLFYPSWWKQHQREQKSAAGKKGQEIKQASTPKPSRKTET
jgi:hypothetical protein